MKTTIELPDALLLDAKSYASEHGLTLKQVIEAGIRRVVADRSRARSFRLRKATFKGRGVALEGGWEAIRREIYQGRGE